MKRPRLATRVFASLLVPAGCTGAVPCADPGSICLALDDLTHVRVGFQPDAITLADLDADGQRDLVGASSTAGTVTVVWGQGGGFAGNATTWSIDQEVAGVVVADLDGDGRLDLATALPRADAVAVVRGRGGRSFADPERHPVGAVPRALVAADLDGAQPLELVTANLGDGTVSVLRRFIADPPLVVGPGPRALAGGDLDGDGHQDLAVTLADADAVQVLRGDGTGGLWPAALHPVGAAPYGLVVADLDLDGRLDLATADSLDDTISVLWGDGAGGLRDRTTWPTAAAPGALVLAQPIASPPVLAVLSETTSTIQRLDPRTGAALTGVLTSKPLALAAVGDALFTAGDAVTNLSPGTGLIMTPVWQDRELAGAWPVDLDGDGVDELLLQEASDELGVLTVRRGDVATGLSLGLTSPETVRGADLTGDDRTDLLVRDDDALLVVVQGPDGALQPGTRHDIPGLRDFVLVDLDGDAVSEVVVLSDDGVTSRLDRLRSDDAGAFTLVESSTFTLDRPPDVLRVIDGDGDDLPDLVLERGHQHYYFEDGRGPLRALELDVLYIGDDITFVDFDRDGRLDGLFCDFTGPSVVLDILAAAPSPPSQLFTSPCHSLALLDLDRDGEPELLLQAYDDDIGSTRFTPWTRHGDAWVERGSRTLSGLAPGWTFAELDGGGAPELLLGVYQDFTAMRLDLGPALLETVKTRLSDNPQLRFGDLDGDGAADLLAFGMSIAVARADGRGGFEPLRNLWSPEPTQIASRPISAGLLTDLDGDGTPQFLWPLARTTRLVTADVSLAGLDNFVSLDGALYGGLSRLFSVDLDRDGQRDILTFDLEYGRSASLVRGRADGGFAEPEPFMLDEHDQVSPVGLHDMDGDGDLDILGFAYSREELRGAMRLYLGAGDGTFAAGRHWSDVHQYDPWTKLLLGDFDRDGRAELVMNNGAGELLWVRGGEGGGVRLLLEGIGPCASADLDRDGHPELLATEIEGQVARLHIGRSRSDGSFGFTSHDIDGVFPYEIQTADVDGDGALDIVLVDVRGATIVRRRP